MPLSKYWCRTLYKIEQSIDNHRERTRYIRLDIVRPAFAHFWLGPELILAEQHEIVVHQNNLDNTLLTVIGELNDKDCAGINGTLQRMLIPNGSICNTVGVTLQVGCQVFGVEIIILSLLLAPRHSKSFVLVLGPPKSWMTKVTRNVVPILSEILPVAILYNNAALGESGVATHASVGDAGKSLVPGGKNGDSWRFTNSREESPIQHRNSRRGKWRYRSVKRCESTPAEGLFNS